MRVVFIKEGGEVLTTPPIDISSITVGEFVKNKEILEEENGCELEAVIVF
ncbi:MAG: hypothetical protein M0Q88_08015 [Bacilli bacterium]|nr:hypothetical protein [Bacilli bacterium]